MSREKLEQPKNLDDAFRLLKDMMGNNLTQFKDTLEGNALAMTHFGLGMYLRNNWYLWWHMDNLPKPSDEHNKDYPLEKPEIVKYFNEKLAIFHADDMSGIILTSFHRHLNDKPLDLEKQLKRYHDHWAKIAKKDTGE